MKDRAILTKNFTPSVSAVYWQLFAQISFPPFLAAISDMVGDREIFAKFLTPRLSAESTGEFST